MVGNATGNLRLGAYEKNTHCTVCNPKKGKEHIVVPLRHELADHSLCVLCFYLSKGEEGLQGGWLVLTYGVVRSLEQTEYDIVEIEFPLIGFKLGTFVRSTEHEVDAYPMVIPNTVCPKAYHSPKGNENAEKVRKKEHALGSYLEILLEIPESERRRNRANRLSDSKVRYLEK